MLNAELERLHRQLNQAQLVPRGGFRRNTLHYPIICYINNIIGLYLSQNFEVIPTFLRRALVHIREFKQANPEVYAQGDAYYALVLEYLSLMAHFIASLEQIDPVARRLIPGELLSSESNEDTFIR